MRYLYEDSNGWYKFIDVSVYKVTDDHSVAVNLGKNELYLKIMKVKEELFN